MNWNIKICDFGLSTVKSKLGKKLEKGAFFSLFNQK